jgi:hypothetical protein
MNYEKLTVDSFIQKAKDGKYSGLTGARRAIGKTDWSDKDRKTAHAFADKFFAADDASKSKPARTPKVAKGKTERAPRTIKKAKKSPARAARAVPAASAAVAPRRTPATPRPVRTPVVPGPSLPRMMQGDDPSTVRAHSAALIVSALRNSGALNTDEQLTYDTAIREYSANARDSARLVGEAAAGKLPFPKGQAAGSDEAASGEEGPQSEVTAPPGTAARIAVQPTNGEGQKVDPADQAAHDRLNRAKAAQAATEGPPPRN